MAKRSIDISIKLGPWFLPAIGYVWNELRNFDINFDLDFDGEHATNKIMTAVYHRNILPFFFKKKHHYCIDLVQHSISVEQAKKLVEFEIRHPIISSFARLFYMHKLPYPKIE